MCSHLPFVQQVKGEAVVAAKGRLEGQRGELVRHVGGGKVEAAAARGAAARGTARRVQGAMAASG